MGCAQAGRRAAGRPLKDFAPAFPEPQHAALDGQFVERCIAGGGAHPARIDPPGRVSVDQDQVGRRAFGNRAAIQPQDARRICSTPARERFTLRAVPKRGTPNENPAPVSRSGAIICLVTVQPLLLSCWKVAAGAGRGAVMSGALMVLTGMAGETAGAAATGCGVAPGLAWNDWL